MQNAVTQTGPANNEPFFELPTAKEPEEEPGSEKKWYKKWWGILITVSSGLILLLALLFFGQVYFYYSQIKSGRLSLPAKAQTSSESILAIAGFFDFQCPFSKEANGIMNEIKSLYGGKINFVFRNFPLSEIHPDAMLAAQAGECARAQNGFEVMRDKIFGGIDLKKETLEKEAAEIGLDGEAFAACLDDYKSKAPVLKDFRDGQTLGVTGTPTWFIEGKKIEGVIPAEAFKKIIDYFLAQKNIK